jgi:hypothetical protein
MFSGDMRFPTTPNLRQLFKLLDRHAPDLKAPCRWLLVGPNLAVIIMPEHSRQPDVEDLTRLMRLLKKEAKELVPVGRWMLAASEQSAATLVELQLDQLLEAHPEDWSHPIQVLERPRAGLPSMLRACRLRMLSAQGNRRKRLLEVRDKLERAVRIARSAEKRRAEFKRKNQQAKDGFSGSD